MSEPPRPPYFQSLKAGYRLIVRSLTAGFLVFALFIDLLTPVGISTGFIYVGIVVFSAYETGPHGGLLTAAVATVFSLIGYFISPGDPVVPQWAAAVNRSISIGVTWLVAVIIFLHLRATEQAGVIRVRLQKEQTERRQRDMDLAYVATHDALTGLPNRALLLDRLSHALLKLNRDPQSRLLAVYLDVDRFREINVALGNDVGDVLLRQLADRLKATVRPGDTTARLTGDEFIILVEQIRAQECVEALISRVWAALYAPFEAGGQMLHPSFSLGLALIGGEYNKADAVLRDAYLAMRAAKSRGGGTAVSFSGELRNGASQRAQLEQDLRRAVRSAEFVWHYQPIVELPQGRVVGVEALVRWEHPQRGMVSPGEFIPIAEGSGIITAIDWLGLQEVCARLKSYRYNHPGQCRLTVHVNISPKCLSVENFSQDVINLLEKCQFPNGCLGLEITEEALDENKDRVKAIMNRLLEHGVAFSVDDFGTRYSSLAYLYEFPFKVLKVDRSFTALMLKSPKHLAIVEAIIALARILDLKVIVEGVETEEEMLMVYEMGAAYAQGYLFSKPIPWEEFEVYASEKQ